MSNAQDFVTSFMKHLAGEGVELTSSLQAVFAKILAEQVVVDADTSVVSFKPVFSTLLKVLTFIATPEADRPEAGSSYTQDAIDTAADSAATETGLTVGEEIPTEAPTEEPTDGPTDEPTEEPGVEGKTLELTTGADVFAPLAEGEEAVEGVQNTTANDDTIEGALTSRSSTTTFSTEDKLDGGAGTDTLKLSIDKDFRGYSKDEVGIQNIENLELTNEGSRKRKFDVSNIENLENIALHMGKAELELAGISSVDTTIEAHNLAKGNLKLGYTTGAVSSASDDTLNLVLNNIGTASVGVFGCKDYKAAETITLDATGLGQLNNLNINSMGTLNQFNVGTVGIDTITLTGAATTSLTNVSTQLNSFDASAATGKVTANLSNAATQNLKDIAAGTNDDKISVNATGLATTVKLNGGEGNNTLTIAADADKTIKPTMENFQTLAVTGVNKLTVSGEGVDGLTTVNYDMTGELLLANLDNTELTLNLGNASAGKATYTGEGQLIINTTAGNANPVDCDGKLVNGTPTASSATVVASEAEVVDFNVKAFSTYSGTITAGKAEEVTLNIESALYNDTHAAGIKDTEATAFAGTLQANEASIVNINAEGKLGGIVTASKAEELNLNVAAHDNILELNASEAQALTLTVEGDKAFAIGNAAGSLGNTANLNKVEELQVTTSGQASISVDMKKLASATIAGTGSFAIGTPAVTAVTGTSATATIDTSSFTFDGTTSTHAVTGAHTLAAAAYADADALATAIQGIATVDSAVNNAGIITVTYTVVPAGSNPATAFAVEEDTKGDASVVFTEAAGDLTPGTTGVASSPFTAKDVGGEAQDVALDATDLLGDFAVKVVGYTNEDTKDANGTADVFGSGVGVNNITVEDRQTVEITGGVQNDSITVRGAVYNAAGALDAAGIATAMVTGGLGADTFGFSSTTSNLLATITDFEVGVDVLTGGAAITDITTVFTNRAAVVTALETTFDVVTSVNTTAVITQIEIDLDGNGVATSQGFEYDGDVYVHNGDANVLVQLTGLSEADYTATAVNGFA